VADCDFTDVELFSDRWWDVVLAAWNASNDARLLAGIGCLRFELDGDPARQTWVVWDDRGHGVRTGAGEPFTSAFSGSPEEWRAFMDGDVDAMLAMLTGRLRFTGSLPRIFPYVRAFDALALVARCAF
jgi:putative sterol carrier protein